MATAAKLSHVDTKGRARMVDLAGKPETDRRAVAEAFVRVNRQTLALVRAGGGKKGDVLGTARLAGITAAKKTSEIIPLCHPVRLSDIDVEVRIDAARSGMHVRATARAFDRTGVEMEAMVGAAAAALTVYDMVKAVQRDVTIESVRLIEKRGGRSGIWLRRRGAKDKLRRSRKNPAS